jgi:hypothetical protein
MVSNEEVISMPAMLVRNAGVLLAAGLAAMVAVLPCAWADEKAVNESDALARKVDRRVEAWQPTPQERRLDDIGWAKDLREALRLARESGRPVFLFTYSGCAEREHAIALQRC